MLRLRLLSTHRAASAASRWPSYPWPCGRVAPGEALERASRRAPADTWCSSQWSCLSIPGSIHLISCAVMVGMLTLSEQLHSGAACRTAATQARCATGVGPHSMLCISKSRDTVRSFVNPRLSSTTRASSFSLLAPRVASALPWSTVTMFSNSSNGSAAAAQKKRILRSCGWRSTLAHSR